jgi:prolipoprotein diacylglyceryltransferase
LAEDSRALTIIVAAVLYQWLQLIGRTRMPTGGDSFVAANFSYKPTLLNRNPQQLYKASLKAIIIIIIIIIIICYKTREHAIT